MYIESNFDILREHDLDYGAAEAIAAQIPEFANPMDFLASALRCKGVAAYTGRLLCGFGLYRTVDMPTDFPNYIRMGSIDLVAVGPKKSGIGSQLVRVMLSALQQNNVPAVGVQLSEGDPGLPRFYGGLGFREAHDNFMIHVF